MSPLHTRLRNLGLASLLVALQASAQAAILGAALNSDGTNQSPELFLVLFDQTTSKTSYTLNLGIDAANFWVQAQQDTGASLFRTLDPATDSAFNSFISGANLSNVRWMITGGTFDGRAEADRVIYVTQTNNNSLADQRAFYDRAHGVLSGDMTTALSSMGTYVKTLNGARPGIDIVQSTIGSTSRGGSGFASKLAGNTATYTDATTGFKGLATGSDGSCIYQGFFCAGNPLGVSSWFYKVMPSLLEGEIDPSSPVVIDEFDNVNADGYWGLIKDPNSSKYVLSYTLTGANPSTLVSTDGGRTRLSFVDYSAQSGIARLIGISADDVALQSTVTAVPEPAQWGLLLGGVGLLAALRRRKVSCSAR